MTIYASVNLTTRIEDTPASCPYYAGTGDRTCKSGCWQEPACITGEPHGGWGAEVYIQHNEPNPILLAFRQGLREDGSPLREVAGDYSEALSIYSSHAGADERPADGWEDRDPFDLVTTWPTRYIDWPQRDHARRVLERLAALA